MRCELLEGFTPNDFFGVFILLCIYRYIGLWIRVHTELKHAWHKKECMKGFLKPTTPRFWWWNWKCSTGTCQGFMIAELEMGQQEFAPLTNFPCLQPDSLGTGPRPFATGYSSGGRWWQCLGQLSWRSEKLRSLVGVGIKSKRDGDLTNRWLRLTIRFGYWTIHPLDWTDW
jgi:hypothetical protein